MRRMVPVLSAAALAALASAAVASIVLRVSPRELADTANLVVEGRVASVDVRWDDDRTCINHYVTLNVERVHKGTAGGSVVVKVPGGRVGEDEVRVEGTASFAVDEEVMAFLWKDGMGEWLVLGEAQGKFLLRRDAKSGVRMAENSLRGLCLVLRVDPKGPGAAAAKRPDIIPYDELVTVVKDSVDAARAKAALPAVPGQGPTAGEPGKDPAVQGPAPVKTPDPPVPTTQSNGGAPPPTKDAPVPPTGNPDTAKDGRTPPPSPDEPKR